MVTVNASLGIISLLANGQTPGFMGFNNGSKTIDHHIGIVYPSRSANNVPIATDTASAWLPSRPGRSTDQLVDAGRASRYRELGTDSTLLSFEPSSPQLNLLRRHAAARCAAPKTMAWCRRRPSALLPQSRHHALGGALQARAIKLLLDGDKQRHRFRLIQATRITDRQISLRCSSCAFRLTRLISAAMSGEKSRPSSPIA